MNQNNLFLNGILNQEDAYRFTKRLLLNKGAFLIDEYEKSKYFYFIESGFASVNILQDSQEYISAFVLPGDICGLDSVSSSLSKKHNISVISKEMTCWRVDTAYFINTCTKQKELIEFILKQCANILQRHYDIFEITSLPLEERITKSLFYLGKYMGIKKADNIIYLPSFITQSVLAKFCHSTQPHISKQLKNLATQNIIISNTIPIAFHN